MEMKENKNGKKRRKCDGVKDKKWIKEGIFFFEGRVGSQFWREVFDCFIYEVEKNWNLWTGYPVTSMLINFWSWSRLDSGLASEDLLRLQIQNKGSILKFGYKTQEISLNHCFWSFWATFSWLFSHFCSKIPRLAHYYPQLHLQQ